MKEKKKQRKKKEFQEKSGLNVHRNTPPNVQTPFQIH